MIEYRCENCGEIFAAPVKPRACIACDSGPLVRLPRNPYPTPVGDADWHPITYKAHSGFLKWLCVAPLVGSIALVVALDVVGINNNGKTLITVGAIASLVAVFIWIYSAWSAIPIEHRVTESGKPISPGKAVIFLFVPVYNLYWMFVSSCGICQALDRMLCATTSSRRAPRDLAIAACTCQLIPRMNTVVAPLLWLWFMFRFDAAAQELERALVNSAQEADEETEQSDRLAN